MSLSCTRCGGSGFLNADQLPEHLDHADTDEILTWLSEYHRERNDSCCTCHINPPCGYCVSENDVEICDCCGDGEDWYGMPGEHYGPDDPQGPDGPYSSNGGLCKCH